MAPGRHLLLRLMAAALCLVRMADAALAEDTPDFARFDEAQAVAYSQAAIGRTVSAAGLLDSERRKVSLESFRGKPLIVSLVYTSCYHTCPLITQTLERSVSAARNVFGADGFAVVTIGFDSAEDTPERMRAFARERGIDETNWQFLSADAATISSLTKGLGFIYFPSPRGFDHLAQTTILDSAGRVYAHVYGSEFSAPAVVEPLKQLIYGTTASTTSVTGIINRIRLFCTVYDPRDERYRFDYSVFVGLIIGALCLSGIATVLGLNAWRLWRGDRPA